MTLKALGGPWGLPCTALAQNGRVLGPRMAGSRGNGFKDCSLPPGAAGNPRWVRTPLQVAQLAILGRVSVGHLH